MKKQDLTQLSVNDVTEQMVALEDKLKQMKLAHTVSPLENPLQIRATRKKISQLKTELTKRNKKAKA
jgi:large subunit ribosomal protein L29